MTSKDILLGLPSKVNAELLNGIDTVFHFKVNGEGGGDFTAKISNNEFIITEGLEGESKCTITTSNETFLGIINKSVNPQMAVFTGKLKISNLSEMMKYAKAFGLG